MTPRLIYSFLIISNVWLALGASAWGNEVSQTVRTYAFPTDPFSYQPGPGQELANVYCIICHSAEYMYTQPPHSKKTWIEIVNKMKRAMGCPIPDDQIGSLATYLFQQNSTSPIPPPASP